METIETDHLVIGAGASGMAFVDALVTSTDDEVVLVDRRHQPGGHWVDAYPFVRLHQPSAYYGVGSRQLGDDRRNETGPEAGWYPRASGAELVDYYQRVLDEQLLPSDRVRFLAATEHVGAERDGHVVVSRLTGRHTLVRPRSSFVDATYVESTIPSRHERPFDVEPGAAVVSPNELVDIADGAGGFVVLGAGKTAMDVCVWLLDHGVDPGEITWVRPRDGWFVSRAHTQPFELSGAMLDYQSRMIEAATTARDGAELAHRLEEHGMMFRVDTSHEPVVYRGATISPHELGQLRRIERVVRLGTVRTIAPGVVHLTEGELSVDRGAVHVDCTAPGLATPPARPIFEPGRVTIQFTTMGVAPWSAALLGFVAGLDVPLEEKNRWCPPLTRWGTIDGQLLLLAEGLPLEGIRREVPELAEWNAGTRLNPGRSIPDCLGDPDAQAAMLRLLEHVEPAVAHLRRLADSMSSAAR
ncbi:MAG: NAD(P)-binding protein [Actinomycetota bacterium]